MAIRLNLISGRMLFFVGLCCGAVTSTLVAQDEPATVATGMNQTVRLLAEAKLDEAVAQCTELIASDADPMTKARVYGMMALTYYLQDCADAAERVQDLYGLCAEDETLDRAALLPALGYLAGTQSAAAMTTALQSATPDWMAFGILCQYVLELRANQDSQALHARYREYADAVAMMASTDWVAAWAKRVPHWQQCLQERTRTLPLEPLIANRIPDLAKEQDANRRILVARQLAFLAINGVINHYLENQPEAAIAAARQTFAERPDLAPADATGIDLIFAYLAGDRGITPRELFQSCQANPKVWAIGCIAMFVRDLAVAVPGQLPQAVLLSHLDNFTGNLQSVQDEGDVVVWASHTPLWEQWCTGNFAAMAELPPLLASRSQGGQALVAGSEASKFTTLAGLTPEEFALGREERYLNRPRPASLEFSSNQLNRYLETTPAELQDLERRRFKVVSAIKPQLVKIFERNPYRGVVVMNNGTKNGAIVRANENILVFKRNERSKHSERILWTDLAFEQYCVFFEHFAKVRLAISAGGESTAEDRQFDAANDYLGLALLCDWYGHYAKALEYAQRAVTISAKIDAAAAALLRP